VSGSSFSGSASTDSFFIAPGGGADFRITHNIWLRGGADYFRTGKYGVTVNGVRAFAGVTFTFGGNRASSNPARSDPAASNPGQPEQSPQPLRAMDSTKINVGVLGLTVVTAESAGAKVAEVTPNSPAAKAGLHSGDVINSVDGAPIKTPSDLTTQLAVRSSQEKIRIGYLVHGQWQTEVVVFLSD
jgi:membrane-associated protease RseP (regulator of RpoE activity)